MSLLSSGGNFFLFTLPTEAYISKVYDAIAEWNALFQKRRLNEGKLIWRPFNGSTLHLIRLRRSASGGHYAWGGPQQRPSAGLRADNVLILVQYYCKRI
jgi:hypothetical protein